MADVFISYNRSDRDRAERLAHALEARGLSVWWDTDIPPGRQYDDVIEQALSRARCVLALWSEHSVASKWVRNEAGDALDRGILIPVLLVRGLKLPLEFRRVQAADLSDWVPGTAHEAFDQMLAEVHRLLGLPPAPPRSQPPSPPPPAPPPVPPPPPGVSSRWVAAGLLGVVAVAGLFGLQQAGLLSGNGNPQDIQPVDPKPASAPTPAPTYAPAPEPAPAPAPQPAGIQMPLSWRDYVLVYQGRVFWDGQSPQARIDVVVSDSATGYNLVQTTLAANVTQPHANELYLTTQVVVPGDSQTAGPHPHTMNLVFQRQGRNAWQFVQNCMAPGQCYR